MALNGTDEKLKTPLNKSNVEGRVMKLNGFKEDNRPQKNWWAPGHYACTCHICGEKFMGDKRAGQCADCAYDT